MVTNNIWGRDLGKKDFLKEIKVLSCLLMELGKSHRKLDTEYWLKNVFKDGKSQ